MISIALYKRSLPLFLIAFFLGSLFRKTTAQTYGLAFSSHEVIPEQRTSLDLTDGGAFCFSSQVTLSFDLQFTPDLTTYFGYVFRLINESNQNIDLIFDQHKQHFRIINQEAFTDVNFDIGPAGLYGGWTRVTFTIDKTAGLTCSVNNKIWKTGPLNLKSTCFKVIFGVSNEHNFVSSDVPPMKLKNIALETDGSKKYYWPLNESSGVVCSETMHQKNGKVLNPAWLMVKHSNWQLVKSLTLKGTPSMAFNQKKEDLYIISADTFYALSGKGLTYSATALSTPHSFLLPGNQSIYNTRTNTLYNFYTDQQIVSTYDFNQKSWSRNFQNAPSTEFWQVNKFCSGDNQLYVLLGYGQLKYKNTIRKIDPVTNKWDTVHPGGDYLEPRYLSALGASISGDTAYILGGYGNKEGDQLLSPKHFYDLLRYDVKNNTVKRLFTLPEPQEQFAFANSMVIDSQQYYALVFPNSRFNTKLQLIRGSLTDSTYTLLGQPFPYSFIDVRSFADLYYCKNRGLLLAATMYTNKEWVTEVNIYSIYFPPNEAGNTVVVAGAPGTSFNHLYWILPIVVLMVIIAVMRRKKKVAPVVVEELTIPVIVPPNIQLFGNFNVVTTSGDNLTKQFTPLLKEMFLLILIHSLKNNKGVTAEKLTEILWKDKDTKDAINNRSVNLVKLKNILEKLEGSTISRKTGGWQFEYDPAKIRIDYHDYLQSGSDEQLLRLVQNGSFLPETHYEWLDNFKSEISNDVIERLTRYTNMQTGAEKILAAADAIFSFDELNEHALKLKCKSLITLGRHALANSTYTKFTLKYNEIYGEDYKRSYSSLISQ